MHSVTPKFIAYVFSIPVQYSIQLAENKAYIKVRLNILTYSGEKFALSAPVRRIKKIDSASQP